MFFVLQAYVKPPKSPTVRLITDVCQAYCNLSLSNAIRRALTFGMFGPKLEIMAPSVTQIRS